MKTRNICLVVLFSLCLSACAQVQPWQRNLLAKPEMAWQPDPLSNQLSEHIYFSKEGSTGGNRAAGGGCGCN